MTPKFKHDCEKCIFLGHYNEKDLYFCDQNSTNPTLIQRYSDDSGDYFSAIAIVNDSLVQSISPDLRVAFLIARELGLISEFTIKRMIPPTRETRRNKNRGNNRKIFK